MKNFNEFKSMAMESANLVELMNKIKATGSNAFITDNNELWSGVNNYYGYIRYIAIETENGIACQMF